MLFISVDFIFYFLPVVLAVYFALAPTVRRRIALIWLVAASLFFYAVWYPPYLALLVASIAGNYLFGQALMRRSSRTVLALGVGANLALLGYFKYANFFIENANAMVGGSLSAVDIGLPLAISFFTFQQIAYLVDVHQGKVRDSDFVHYALFVSFFPQLIAGPIVHHSEIIPQFSRQDGRRRRRHDLGVGFAIFLIGLQKKIVLADGIAVYADSMFAGAAHADPSFFPAWIGALAYTFQLYFDFSGYSDMAIGLARIFGITLPVNFHSPYKAVNIIDFWRRWHITLARFLRDYLYVPLGGNRRGRPRRYANLMVTMLLGGLWHGASWTFVVWGGLHGLFLVINHAWRASRRALGHDLERSTALGRALSRALTLLAVIVGWVFFRAPDWPTAIAMLSGMAGLNGVVLPEIWALQHAGLALLLEGLGVAFAGTPFQGSTILWLAALLVIVLAFPNTQQWVTKAEGVPAALRARAYVWAPAWVGVAGVVALLVVVAKGSATNEFIYMVF